MTDQPQPSALEIRVVDEGAAARVRVPGNFNPDELSVDLLAGMAQERGVEVHAAARQRLEEIVDRFRADGEPVDEVFVEAQQPEHGIDGGVVWDEGYDPTDTYADPHNDSGHKADYYNSVEYVHIAAGVEIGTWNEPTPGEDGRDVTGRTIPAKPGKKASITLDASLMVNPQGRIVSQSDGVLQLERGVVKVTRLLEVKGFVDFSTGNIDFDGSVVIRDGVRDRFEVKATEDVTVGGLVEAATIRCDRNFVCRRGMAAKERGQLLVRGDAEVGFLENVRGSIGGTLTIRRDAIGCDLAVGRDLVAPSASIIGGTTIVTRSMKVGALGSAGETPTLLVLGAVPFISAQIKALKKKIHAADALLREKLERQQMLTTAEKRLSHSEKEQLTEMSFEVSEVQQELNRLQAEHERLVEEMKARGTVDVTVMQVIHSRVRLRARDSTVVFDREVRGPVRIGWDERHRLLFRQGDTPPRPISDVTHLEQLAA